MSRPQVLLLGEVKHAHETWSVIAQQADVVVPQSTDRAGFLEECRAGALDGVVAAYRTFGSTGTTGRLDATAVALLPAHTPHAVDDATADLGIWLMLGALRNLAPGLGSLRAGRWRDGDGGNPPGKGHDPRGKTLGILGMGGIGRNMARKAALAFGMRVVYHNRTRLAAEDEREAGEATYVGFEELLRESDVLSLNLPLNPSTTHLISHPQLAQTKPGVVLVNTARGAVVDEAALAAFLDRGHVAAVGLDVYEHEPEVHPALLRNPRALLVPHMGTWTVETERAMEEATMANVRSALAGTGLTSGVPEQRGLAF
ncbi:glyoxylate reductase [Apiospora phragmitis]|uniref:Glyoxylate reductase n=1 Tax=Apiospora phragmitis TaxID=2905665 RepID=A0ABR1W678_9PEZI